MRGRGRGRRDEREREREEEGGLAEGGRKEGRGTTYDSIVILS